MLRNNWYWIDGTASPAYSWEERFFTLVSSLLWLLIFVQCANEKGIHSSMVLSYLNVTILARARYRYWLDCLWRKQTLLNLWRKRWTQWITFKITYILIWLHPNMWVWITWVSISTGNLTSCGYFSEILGKHFKQTPLKPQDIF